MDKTNEIKTEDTTSVSRRPPIITSVGTVIMILLILATLEISRRGLSAFISTQERYVIGLEGAVLAIFAVEMVVRLLTLRLHYPQLAAHGTRLRLLVRIVGYSIAFLCIVSIIAANATLGISVGAIVGVVIAFAAQNIVGSMLAAVLILSTRMIRIGEEITVSQTKGKVANITLTHTVVSVDEDIVFLPNSLLISSLVRRKKRSSRRDTNVDDW